jgi:hypothetical protein
MHERSYANDELSCKRSQPLPFLASKLSTEGQHMIETLAEKKCTPCRGGIPPLTHEEAERFRSQTPNWELRDDATVSNEPSAFAISRKRSTLFETWVIWLKPKAIIPISASAGVAQPSRCAPRKSRDCTRTILSWRVRSIECLITLMAVPTSSEG